VFRELTKLVGNDELARATQPSPTLQREGMKGMMSVKLANSCKKRKDLLK